MENSLIELFSNNQGKITDKWTLYLNLYEKLLKPYENHEVNILEIGIQNGGTLEIWGTYFKRAKNIIGCDVDPECIALRYSDHRIKIVVGDANTNDTENSITNHSKDFDIIIDDGSHKSSDVIKSFFRYFPYLTDNGIYIIEDTHTSYWKNYEGGLYNPYSTLSFVKRLIDIINYEHWRLSGVERKCILRNIAEQFEVDINEFDLLRLHSIKFYNSICVIEKKKPEENILGKRLVVGEEEPISNGFHLLHNSQIQDFSAIIEDDHQYDTFSLIDQNFSSSAIIDQLRNELSEREESIQQFNAALAEREQTIQEHNAALAEREQEVLFYALSKSWRITRPMRKIAKFFRRIIFLREKK